ncbi:glycosyltransferase [Riemerella anatipestifer]|uniref:glycosyltransferase n=1 Tax=Riemerella anatipestifer TaxID=34085 RepID=UPI002265C043|nr:glycosyltransferase [Riemerella anatipestifer]UZX28456.1 glycosyltransferase [Riemerella anatipestifer]
MEGKGKKVLLVYYKLFKPGGVAKVMTTLANELVEEGYKVEILLLMSPRPNFYPLNENVKIHHIDTFSHWAWKICEFNVKWLKFVPKIQNINAYIHHIGVYLMLKKWLKQNHQNYDTIISCWYKLSSFIGVMGREIAKKTIAWEHIYYGVGGFVYAKKLRQYYKNLKSIVCINTPSITHYRQFNNTDFIPNLMGDDFEKLEYKNYLDKKNHITFVGRLEIEKNVTELLDIFSEIKDKKDWVLQIIGDGVLRYPPEAQVENLGLKDKVIFLGKKSTNEIIHILQESKIFALTSTVEAFGLVLVEAMFCSNVLIAYDCNYGPSDIINKNNGFLIPLKNKESFREKLQYLLDNSADLERLSHSSYREAQKWKKDKILEQWKKII